MLNRCVSPSRVTEKKEWMVVHPLATLRMFTRAARKWELSTRERTSPASTTSSSVYPKYGGSKSIKGISQDPFGTTSETLLNFFLGDPLVYTNTLICIQIWTSLMMNMDGLSPHQLQGPLQKKLVLLRSIDHFYRILVVPHFKTHMLYEQKIPVSDFLTILRSDSLMIWWFFSWFFSDQLSALALYCSSVSSTSNSPPPARFNFSTSCQDIWYMFHYYTLLTLLQIKKSKKYR